jgi:hypothetical protein
MTCANEYHESDIVIRDWTYIINIAVCPLIENKQVQGGKSSLGSIRKGLTTSIF